MKKKGHIVYALIGQVIMVDPSVATKDESGKPGIIFSVSPESGLAHIEFNNGKQGEYLIDKLSILAPKAMIMQRLLSNWEIDTNDLKTALRTYKLISEKRFADALDTVATNEAIRSLVTISCTEWLAIQGRNNKHSSLRK